MSAKMKEVWKVYFLHCVRGCVVESESEWKELIFLEYKKDFESEADAEQYIESIKKDFEAAIEFLILKKRTIS